MQNIKYQNFQTRFDKALCELLDKADDRVPQRELAHYKAEVEKRDQELKIAKDKLAHSDLEIETMTNMRKKELVEVENVLSKLKPFLEE